MVLDQQEADRRLQAFKQGCKAAGEKLTSQRIEIFREIAASEEHPDAESIYKGVRERLPNVSLDTVYRTLWWLTKMGMVTTLGPTQDRTRFDANLTRHHHFVCIRCGLTRDFYSEELNRLKLPESVAAIGSIERTQVEVKGICHVCAQEESVAHSILTTEDNKRCGADPS
ncbi:Fur family transcriptional regulator [Fundidesulfovibrio soli]|uniref:Fur family transcriptional regulator n=1 Tax=Fundidesulfovibrio soli TaxID=2922716 RepID=UPI001FAEF354|nr:transcriptional repressor [Fundidesulfovibrio soli]